MFRKCTKKYLIMVCLICMFGVFGLCRSVSAASVGTPKLKSGKAVTYDTVELQWDKVSQASGYAVFQAVSKNGPYKIIKYADSKSTKLTVTNLSCGKTYYFRVRAYRTRGGRKSYGSYSNILKATPVPKAPVIRKAELISDKAAKITWLYTSGADGYYVYRSEKDSSGYKRIAEIPKRTVKEYTDKTIVSGKTYYYKLVAYHIYGRNKVRSASSDYVSVQTGRSFVVTPSSRPYADRFTNIPAYTPKTGTYYMLRSYMELFESFGGGELVLKGGEYNITGTLYVPSNVTIIFSDGVTVKYSGSTKDRSQVLFALAESKTWGADGMRYSSYNGVHDVKLIGQGNVVFDKEFRQNSAVLIGHTRNVLIDGITFRNMRGDTHFIELDASQNTEIRNCTFMDYKKYGKGKEAINIDVPDPNTEGFGGKFSSQDKTPNDDIYIHDNTFKNLYTAIGTHCYTPDSAHKNIRITNNSISNCAHFGIGVMNWKDSLIANNTITNVCDSLHKAVVIDMRGVDNVEVSGNIAKNSDNFIIIKAYKYEQSILNSKPILKNYGTLYNGKVERDKLIHNTISGMYSSRDIYYSNRLDFSDRVFWSVAG